MKQASMLPLILILTFGLSACAAGGAEPSAFPPTSQAASTTSAPTALTGVTQMAAVASAAASADWDDDDLDATWSLSGATIITLECDSISVDGVGATVDGAVVTITSAGTYAVGGTLDDGQLRVDAGDRETVKLVLNGANVSCSTSAPIYVVNADKTVIILADGTDNRIEDGSAYVFDGAESDEPSAALFSHDDLTINGTGSLTVTANYNNGIQGKDDLKFAGGDISVTAPNDGIKGRDSVAVRDAVIRVVAGADGVQSTNGEDATKGFIVVESGTLDITAALDGIQAETVLVVGGGTLAIVSGGGSVNSSSNAGDPGNTWGAWGRQDRVAVDTPSAKGLKAGVAIETTGGSITVDSSDDAIHSNGSVALSGGTVTLDSGDDGIHADVAVHITGGSIDIVGSYEGIESAVIVIDAGDIAIVAMDDGINVRGGADNSSMMGRPGQNAFSESASSYLEINGGHIVVDALGDGIDVNGPVTMTGGTVIVNGPTTSMNGALDYMNRFDISGGLLVAAGSIGMAQAPSTSSAQYSVIVHVSSPLPAGTLFHIETEDGEEVLTFAPSKTYQSVVFSSPVLKDGSKCVVHTGGTSVGVAVDGLYSGGQYAGGSELDRFTISGVVTTVGTAMGGFPGGGGMVPGDRPRGGTRP